MRPFARLPNNLEDSRTLADVLAALDLHVPMTATAAAEQNGLHATGARFSWLEVDGALAKWDLQPGERIQIKAAMQHHRLLPAAGTPTPFAAWR